MSFAVTGSVEPINKWPYVHGQGAFQSPQHHCEEKKNAGRSSFICDTILWSQAYFHCLKELHEPCCHIKPHKAGRFIVCLEKHSNQRALQFQAKDLTSIIRIKPVLYQSFHNQAMFCIWSPSLLLLKVNFFFWVWKKFMVLSANAAVSTSFYFFFFFSLLFYWLKP